MCNCGKRRAAAPAAPAGPRSVTAPAPAPAPRSVAPRAAAPQFLNGRRVRSYMLPRQRSRAAGINPKVWGPPLWRVLHATAERVPVASAAWTSVVTALKTSLPCAECTGHYVAWTSSETAKPQRLVEGETDMRAWWLALHNDVNRRTGKAAWTAEAVTVAYGGVTSEEVGAALVALEGKVGEAGIAALRAL